MNSLPLEKLLQYFGNSAAIRLFRSPNGPFVIDFLHIQFKRNGRITLLHSDLRSALSLYQDRIRERHPTSLRDKPDVYLSDWCSDGSNWLHRFIDASQSEPSYQLTSSTEEVLAFVERALQQDVGFVGTESRLRMILELLQDMVVGASDDPNERLEHLQRQRAAIDQQIEEIQNRGTVESYGTAQLRERFSMAVSLLSHLQSDFRSVEEHFKALTRQVQSRQMQGGFSRGKLLEFALDQEDCLKNEDQGRSFAEFVKLVHSPDRQEKLAEMISQLSQIEELADQSAGLGRFRSMMPMLIAEAEKILRTTQRLSLTLRKLLDTKGTKQRQRLADLLREIQSLAISLSESPTSKELGAEIEVEIEAESVWDRTFWSPQTEFSSIEFQTAIIDTDERLQAFRQLADLERLDWSAMRSQIDRLTSEEGEVTLHRLLERHPSSVGVIEILGYLQIAHDDGHRIDSDREMEMEIATDEGKGRTLRLPEITFMPQRDEMDKP